MIEFESKLKQKSKEFKLQVLSKKNNEDAITFDFNGNPIFV